MSTWTLTRFSAYRGKKREEDEKELAGAYDHEIDGRALENVIQKVWDTRISHCSSGPNENNREGDEIYDGETQGG